MSTDIKYLSNKKERLYYASQLESARRLKKYLKKPVQRECRKAHNSYALKSIDNKNGNKQYKSNVAYPHLKKI